MNEQYMEFLVDSTGKSPRNLKESIRKVQNASAGFRLSWLNEEQPEAHETSQEAFEHLDYIQNELLRQRDVHKRNTTTWPTSPLSSALTIPVGKLLGSVTPDDCTWFINLLPGQGSLPTGSTLTPLTLEQALNKLKHRDITAVNFTLPADGGHILYLLTKAGMGQPDTLSEIDLAVFCSACKSAAAHI